MGAILVGLTMGSTPGWRAVAPVSRIPPGSERAQILEATQITQHEEHPGRGRSVAINGFIA